ncbi:MAG: hypothetical protein IBJ15_08650 [Alphaproteobacteria bacterium]|nr:hypothetical protein [Alphaproteobacteria bacterium]
MTPLRRSSIYAVFCGAAVLVGTAPTSPTPAPSVQFHAEREAGLPDVPHLVGRLVRLAVREALRSK